MKKKETVWIGTREIMERAQCGKTKANEIIHMFMARNQVSDLNKGKGRQMYRVKEQIFNDWIERECKIEAKRAITIDRQKVGQIVTQMCAEGLKRRKIDG